MARSLFGLPFRLLEQNTEGDGGEGGTRATPAQVNQRQNNARLERMNAIARGADARRAHQLADVEHDQVVGPFAGGELDESPEALEQRQIEADELERQTREELEERAREAERLEQEDADAARALQSEGAGGKRGQAQEEGGEPTAQEPPGEEGDEKVIDGTRYYRTIVSGAEKWLTLKQLREGVSNGLTSEETLRRAQEALASASQTSRTPTAAPVELDDKELENIVLSATVGDEEAVRKLVSVLKSRPSGASPTEVAQLVSQQIATQREVDRAEEANQDLLGHAMLAPEFKRRLRAFADAQPNTRIQDAYKSVADQMRKDFAPMLGDRRSTVVPPLGKADRKRTLVTPPRGAGRQPARSDEEREVPVSDQIDAIARSRGQARAHRIRRS